MSFTRVKPPNWAVNEKLTSTQMNTLDTQQANSVDKTSAGDTISGVLALSGVGRMVLTCTDAPDADTTVVVGTSRVFRLSDPTASRTYTLGTTGAVENDTITFWADSTYEGTATIKNGSTTIWKVGNWNQITNQSDFATFIRKGSAWMLLSTGRPNGIMSQTFTGNGSWIMPTGVANALAIAYGGGGGGGGGAPGSSTILHWATGGGGGGGAMSRVAAMLAVPLVQFDIVIGTGGNGGASGVDGTSGTATTITNTSTAAVLTFPGAMLGCHGGDANNAIGGDATLNMLAPGGLAVGGGYWPTSAFKSLLNQVLGASPGCGGEGIIADDAADAELRNGHGSIEGYTGGAAGLCGTWGAMTYRSGGSGGGGGAGAGGNGGAGGTGGAGSNGAGNNGTDGTAASANTGAGGGGGGGGGGGSAGSAGGLGGGGGSGKALILWSF